MQEYIPQIVKKYSYVFNFLLGLIIFYYQEWVDERIGWDVNEYHGLEVVRIPAKLFWLPDIVLYNKYVTLTV